MQKTKMKEAQELEKLFVPKEIIPEVKEA